MFVMHGQTITDEILATSLTKVENLLNGRPLTHVSIDPNDPEAITPNHLLLGCANPSVPVDVFEKGDLSSKKRWRIVQAIADHFWRRWMREYLPSLTERRKWLQGHKNLAVGDIVLVVDANSSRGHWPVGRVTQVFAGPDKIVRSATIHVRSATKTTELHRPVVKLCLLEPEPKRMRPMRPDAGPAMFQIPHLRLKRLLSRSTFPESAADDIIQNLRLKCIIVSRISLSIILVQVVTNDSVPRVS